MILLGSTKVVIPIGSQVLGVCHFRLTLHLTLLKMHAETVSSVEAELANLGEDIKNSPPKASSSGSPGKVSPQKKLGNAEENSLVRKINKQGVL